MYHHDDLDIKIYIYWILLIIIVLILLYTYSGTCKTETFTNNVNQSSGINNNYKLTDNYQGKKFVDEFNFLEGADITNGFVYYVDRIAALNNGLCTFPNNEQQFKMAVDSKPTTSKLRKSVRIESKKRYNGGLFIIDVDHVPEGNSVWPAFWLTGAAWPCKGEIDIIEYVNSYDEATSKNSCALHTGQSCIQDGVPDIVNSSCACMNWDNCKPDISKRECEPCRLMTREGDCAFTGCGTSKNIDVGVGGFKLNEIGGGVYACEWVLDGPIRIWFFPRKIVNQYIPANAISVDTTKWPKPNVEFKACPGAFKDNFIVINTTLCGDWAGNVFNGGMGKCREFISDPNNDFSKAYWLINYVKVFDKAV